MSRVRAVFLDYGGTLDSDGVHWSTLYARAFDAIRPGLPRATLDRAFLASEQDFTRFPGAATLSLDGHVGWQVRRILERLAADPPDPDPRPAPSSVRTGGENLTGVVQDSPQPGPGPDLIPASSMDPIEVERAVTAHVVEQMNRTLARSRTLLTAYRPRFRFAVISNFTPNLPRILDGAGLTPLLDGVFCSAVVGVSKPDPAIFRLALERCQVEPAQAAMVGDSLSSDIVPAQRLGLCTVWIRGDRVFLPGDEAAARHVKKNLSDALAVLAEEGP